MQHSIFKIPRNFAFLMQVCTAGVKASGTGQGFGSLLFLASPSSFSFLLHGGESLSSSDNFCLQGDVPIIIFNKCACLTYNQEYIREGECPTAL